MQPDAAGQSGNSDKETSLMRYQRLRAPAEHGEALQLPPIGSANQVWSDNLDRIQGMAEIRIGDIDLGALQEIGRREVVQLAHQYTANYFDVDLSERSLDRIVMSGHQPELFHPGVWFKNFTLSNLAKRFNCVAINLIVDNDVCGSSGIRYPSLDNNSQTASLRTIPLDRPGPNIPFENRGIVDLDFFGAFPDRVAKAIKPLVKTPLANLIWKQLDGVKDQVTDQPRLGRVIAMGRHRLENQFGLRTLEVPVSQVSSSRSFALFAKSILVEIERFQSAYNQAITEYRTVHKIRSSAHPVPELIKENDWLETPFWVWHRDRPQRKRLFAKLSPGNVSLTDREGWESLIGLDDFAAQFGGLQNEGVCVRPRALVTTMFSRMVLSDLFVHGIGGAKYDQLTDVITSGFFGAVPPAIMTISATMKIKNDFDLPNRADLIELRQRRRQIKFHPETMIESVTPAAQAIIDSKQVWTSGQNAGQRTRQRHLAISVANEQLQSFTTPGYAEISQKIAAAAGDLRKSAVLNSREYSFALFPESLMEELAAMAN